MRLPRFSFPYFLQSTDLSGGYDAVVTTQDCALEPLLL